MKGNGPFIHFSYEKVESGLSSLGNSILSSPTCSSKSSSIQQWQNPSNLVTMSNMYQPTNSIVFNSQIARSGQQTGQSYLNSSHIQSEMGKKDDKISNSFTFTNLVNNSESKGQKSENRM